jgi:hypothetical protein
MEAIKNGNKKWLQHDSIKWNNMINENDILWQNVGKNL